MPNQSEEMLAVLAKPPMMSITTEEWEEDNIRSDVLISWSTSNSE
jgi:hypothetical protein